MNCEEEYLAHLRCQRHQLAQCLTAYGKLTPDEAQVSSELFYPYEPPEQRQKSVEAAISWRDRINESPRHS